MKVFASTLVLFLLAACSTEELSMKDPAAAGTYNKKTRAQEPFNPANPHDHVGAVYGEILDAHYQLPAAQLNHQQLIEQGETLSFLNSGFLSLPGNVPYVPLEAADVQTYLDVTTATLEAALSTAYSTNAIGYLSEIAASLRDLKASDAPYQDAYTSLVAIEAAISSDGQLISREREALLATASIVRIALHNDKKRKRRDRDWEWMTSNIAATAAAAMESQQQAIIMSFATDVYYD